MRIAVDAMGGDLGTDVIVAGAVEGANRANIDLLLVGNSESIKLALDGIPKQPTSLEIAEAIDVIGMEEHAAQAVRRKPSSSIAVALRAVRDGRADAMLSAGNSGAVMAASLLLVGRIPGADRPAIASYLPSQTGRTLILDLGAVADPRPIHLAQFAKMGSTYAREVGGIAKPRVGLLSNGEEPSKGNQLVQETFPLLEALDDLHFVGNVEGRDITRGIVDVVVTDGFTGNVALKVAEGVGAMIIDSIRSEVTASLTRKVAAMVLRPALRAVAARLDPNETGGAALLGVNGIVIIAHGRSDEKAIANAIDVAKRAVMHDVVGHIQRTLRRDVPAVAT